jgi:hypothetical protein
MAPPQAMEASQTGSMVAWSIELSSIVHQAIVKNQQKHNGRHRLSSSSPSSIKLWLKFNKSTTVVKAKAAYTNWHGGWSSKIILLRC